MQVTQWFDSSEQPLYKGVYQRFEVEDNQQVLTFSYWDGKQWYASAYRPNDALYFYKRFRESMYQNLQWCGIAED